MRQRNTKKREGGNNDLIAAMSKLLDDKLGMLKVAVEITPRR